MQVHVIKGISFDRVGIYRRYYRQKRTPFDGAGLCGAFAHLQPASTTLNKVPDVNLSPLTVIPHTRVCSGRLRDAMPNPSGSLFNGRHDPAREIALNGQVPLHQKRVHRPVRQKGIAVA